MMCCASSGLLHSRLRVGKVKVAQFGGHDLRGGFRSGHVREMAVTAKDPLLELHARRGQSCSIFTS